MQRIHTIHRTALRSLPQGLVVSILAYTRALSRRSGRTLTVLVLLAILGVIVLGTVVVRLSQTADKQAGTVSAQEYRQALKGQVDTTGGGPQTGRNPSNQQQTSLAQAASAANGTGYRTDKPAAGLRGHSGHQSSPSDVYGDPEQTGVNSAGCYIDYGIPGEQCVSVALAGADGVLTCDELRTKFAAGVKVGGTDRFHLDHNGDGTACGANE